MPRRNNLNAFYVVRGAIDFDAAIEVLSLMMQHLPTRQLHPMQRNCTYFYATQMIISMENGKQGSCAQFAPQMYGTNKLNQRIAFV